MPGMCSKACPKQDIIKKKYVHHINICDHVYARMCPWISRKKSGTLPLSGIEPGPAR